MRISKEALAEFKVIWKDTYDEDIEDERALKYATQLLKILKAVYGIDDK